MNLQSGMEMTFIFVQIGSGTASKVAFPTNMHSAANVSSTLDSISLQKFMVLNHGTDVYAAAPGTACTSSWGTP
jgi:hypothetical protein